MEEQKVCDAIELQSSPAEINKQEAEKQYHLLTLTRSRIREDLEQRKVAIELSSLKSFVFSHGSIVAKGKLTYTSLFICL